MKTAVIESIDQAAVYYFQFGELAVVDALINSRNEFIAADTLLLSFGDPGR